LAGRRPSIAPNPALASRKFSVIGQRARFSGLFPSTSGVSIRAMKLKFETAFRAGVLVCLLLLGWSAWRAVAQGTNAPAVVETAATAHEGAPTPGWISDLAQTFPFLTRQWLGNELWKYLFSLIYIFLAFYISRLLDFLTGIWLKKWADRTETKFDDLVLGLLHGPIRILAFIIFLRIGLEMFHWPDFVHNAFTKVFKVIVAVSLTYMALKFVDLAMRYWKQRTKADGDRAFDEQLFPVIRKSLKLFVVIVAVLVTLDNIGVNITAAIASLSIGGLAVGLAAQDTLANLFGAVAVFMDKPFRVGDTIQLDGIAGTVESIGLRSTRVRNPDGHVVTVPNKTMGNAAITNVTRRPGIKTETSLGVTCDTSLEKLKQALKILEDTYRAHPMTSDVVVSFNKFTDSSLNILVVHWWKGTEQKAYLAGMQELNLAIKERFDAQQIHFAHPTRTLHVKQESVSK
jgi:MscS family membrane protein